MQQTAEHSEASTCGWGSFSSIIRCQEVRGESLVLPLPTPLFAMHIERVATRLSHPWAFRTKMCQWRNFKGSFNKSLSLALREMNTGTNSPAAHNCITEIIVKGFHIIRLNPNNKWPDKTNALWYFQEDRMSYHVESWSRSIFPLSLPSALMPT